ncbi:MAG: hypothetical protein NDJ92_17245 [Thermoanaerobaculia bacterium]|nr:hypothetical protein [Thermoanaerobaculia bacterium]
MNMTKIIARLMLLTALLLPAAAWAETWERAPLIDTLCKAKFEGKTGEHTTACALQCAKGGYGIVVDGAFLPFDERGNSLALEALKATRKKNALRVTVEGALENGKIRVSKLSID